MISTYVPMQVDAGLFETPGEVWLANFPLIKQIRNHQTSPEDVLRPPLTP